MEKYRTIDLCAGIGGIRRGFELTGRFENVLSAEIDESARKTYSWLYGEEPESDLTTNEFKNLASTKKCDVLLAGFPCQTFSSAGLQRGFNDTTKGTIFFHILEIISRCRPKAVFLENVENLLCHDKGKTLKTIIEHLEGYKRYKVIGVTEEKALDGTKYYTYTRKSFLRNSKDFGVPQNRPRVYIMAFSRKYFGKALDNISDWQLPESSDKTIYEDINSILESNVDDKYYMASGYLETLKRHKKAQRAKNNGFGYVVVNDKRRDGGRMVSNALLATGGSGKECNLIRQPKEGLDTVNLINGKKTPLNAEGIRVMTPVEWGRLQGFIGYAFLEKDGSDRFSFPPDITNSQKYKQLGNSVTVPVIYEMAKFMVRCFEAMVPVCQRDQVLEFLHKNKKVTRNMVASRLDIDPIKCSLILRKLVKEKLAFMHGCKRCAYYTPFPGY